MIASYFVDLLVNAQQLGGILKMGFISRHALYWMKAHASS
jgi:hypothetical protein